MRIILQQVGGMTTAGPGIPPLPQALWKVPELAYHRIKSPAVPSFASQRYQGLGK